MTVQSYISFETSPVGPGRLARQYTRNTTYAEHGTRATRMFRPPSLTAPSPSVRREAFNDKNLANWLGLE